MIEAMLSRSYERVNLVHVRLAFSKDLADNGRFSLAKVARLIATLFRIIFARFRHRATILYYPPAGPQRLPVYRDMVLLLSTSWCFHTRIFHFHAGGLTQLYDSLSPIGKWLFRLAYFGPDLAIRTAELAPDDPKALHARRSVVVHNGIPDFFPKWEGTAKSSPPTILFVGLVSESKGVGVLIDSCRLLKQRGLDFTLDLVGPLQSDAYGAELDAQIQLAELTTRVRLLGTLAGDAKHAAFARSTIFCNPTFFESETFSLVTVEAMQFSIPVVATRWRGIPCVVDDGSTGLLVEPRNVCALTDNLELLLREHGTAEAMGRRGRQRYLESFTLDAFHRSMDAAFSAALEIQDP